MNHIRNMNRLSQSLANVKILSSGIYFPSQIVKSDDLFTEIDAEAKYGWPNNWMSKKLGIVERRVCESNCKPSDLAIPAVQMALDDCPGINLDHIDSVYFCGIERDQPEPATAHVIQQRLGLRAKTAIDIANACYGFVSGLEAAIREIRLGDSRYSLVCTGEVSSRVLYGVVELLKNGMSILEAKKILGALTVGDAGGAVILGPADFDENTGFKMFNKRTESEHFNKCIYSMQNGILKGQMDMAGITKAIYKNQADMINRTLEANGWNEFDWGLCHQTGGVQFGRLANLKGFGLSKMIKTYPKLGNITTNSFPVGFHKLKENANVNSGDKIGCLFSGSGLSVGQFGYRF